MGGWVSGLDLMYGDPAYTHTYAHTTHITHARSTQTITRAGGDKVSEDYTVDDVIVDARLEYTGPQFMDELQRLVRDATKGAGSVEEVEEEEDR